MMVPPSSYWGKTRRLTITLLVFWVLLTFVLNWFADELNQIVIFGFPLGFYMAAQGELIVFLWIIWIYNRRMDRLDAKFGIADE
jgi:putative solute:sodium symporter small subunit